MESFQRQLREGLWGLGSGQVRAVAKGKPLKQKRCIVGLPRFPWRVDISKTQKLWFDELNRTHW